ncbi:uncharacterized protein LOC125948833 [Anopheles darlingi]|uniref:uncharacterized protein LOC125948833 n=1 Tax=Anopheles darlingi TaxID=43151 RepID=UPI0021005063|nr:uncharacterized protein LOC125948833 [Anopheles darlingi]
MEGRQTPNNEEQLVIFLKIIQGIRFHQDKPSRKIALIASLDHTTLNTISRRPITPGGGSASFNASIVWACDRFSVKRMKTTNQPIKLDCFESLPDGRRSLVGSVVIPLRSVPVVPLIRTKQIQPRWYRLIGIETERWRQRKPELQLLVMITDPRYLQTDDGKDSSTGDELSEERQETTIFTNPSATRLPEAVELLEDRGLLQVGNRDKDTDLFLLEIVLKCGRHLDRLAPGENTFQLRYRLLGDHYGPVAERKEKGSAVFTVQEKISINVRSSIAALGHFLCDDFKIAVDVLREDRERLEGEDPVRTPVGTTVIDFVNFLVEKDLPAFKEKYGPHNDTLAAVRIFPIQNIERLEADGGTGDQGDELQVEPSLKCKFSLRFLGSDISCAAEGSSEIKQPTSSPMDDGDCEMMVFSTMQEKPSKTSIEEPTKDMEAQYSEPKHPTEQTKETSERHEKVDIDTILLTAEQDLRDIRRTFAFSVAIGGVKFNVNPSAGMWQLTLQHPKADTPFTRTVLELLPETIAPSDRIEFGDVALKLLFSTLPDGILATIGSEPSKLTLNGPHGLYAYAWLDNGSLLVGTREKRSSGVVVLVNDSGESIAIASVTCTLEEVGLNYNSQLRPAQPSRKPSSHTIPSKQGAACQHHTTGRPFDETIAYYLLEEQKEWMRKERERFAQELREKEVEHLEKLTRDWKAKQSRDEKLLADHLAHAETLVSTLEEARRTLEGRYHGPEHDARVQQQENQFHQQLTAIRAKAIRLQQEAECQIEATRKQCLEMQDQLAEQTYQHQLLLEKNRALQMELDEERERWAKEEEGLRRALDETAQSKTYYKEQWAKLTRELHQLRQELAVSRTPYYQSSTSLVKRPKKPSPRKTPSTMTNFER